MNAIQPLPLFAAGVSTLSGILVICFRHRLANFVLPRDASEETRRWSVRAAVCLALLGQILVIWGIADGLRLFGIAVESAPQ